MNEPIRLIDIPAIKTLEDKLLLGASLHGPLPHTLDAPIRDASLAVFSIAEVETYFQLPEGFHSLAEGSPAREKVEEAYWNYEDRFELDEDFTDDEIVETLLKFGVDMRDGRGLPLRSTKLLFRQAEAAAKGIAGRMPDPADLKLNEWEKKIVKDANSHLAAKKRQQIG